MYLIPLGQKSFQIIFEDTNFQIEIYWPFERFVNT